MAVHFTKPTPNVRLKNIYNIAVSSIYWQLVFFVILSCFCLSQALCVVRMLSFHIANSLHSENREIMSVQVLSAQLSEVLKASVISLSRSSWSYSLDGRNRLHSPTHQSIPWSWFQDFMQIMNGVIYWWEATVEQGEKRWLEGRQMCMCMCVPQWPWAKLAPSCFY